MMGCIQSLWNLFFTNKQISIPLRDDEPVIETKKIALIVGHDAYSGGAKLYNGMSEYKFNNQIATMVINKIIKIKLAGLEFKGKQLRIFYRDDRTIKETMRSVGVWGAELSIELHVNASDYYSANGLEILCIKGDLETIAKARQLATAISYKFGSKLRGDKGIKEVITGERGFVNVSAARAYGVQYPMLLEPFFGNFETVESRKFVENMQQYADEIVDFIVGV